MFVKRRVWTNLLLLVLLFATSTPIALAQSPEIFMPLINGGSVQEVQGQQLGRRLPKAPPNNVYIVVMSADPVVAYTGQTAGLAATAPDQGNKVDPNSAQVQEYVQYLQQSHNVVLATVGVDAANKLYDYTYAFNGFAARLTPEQAKALAMQPNVTVILRDEFRHVTTDNSPSFLGLDAPSGPWAKKIKGENVLVGVIDTGIWPEHPSFADDGSYRRLPGVSSIPCEFGNTAHNPADAPFTCNNKLIGARQFLETYKLVIGLTPDEFDSARDDDGHGTHTASTAAGNAGVAASIFGIPRGTIAGIAPRARIIAYKGCAEQGCFTSDTAAAIDTAVADGVDVINYSIGGGATLTGVDDFAFLFAADAGVFVAASAGNEGPDPETVGSPAAVPWVTAVGASSQSRSFISEITANGPGDVPTGLWGGSITPGISDYDLVDAEGIADTAGDTSGQCLNPFPAGTFDANDAVLCNNAPVNRSVRVVNVAAGSGGAVILLNPPGENVTPTDNHPLPTVHMLYDVGQQLREYLLAHPGEVTISFTESVARFAPADPRVKSNVMAIFSSRGPDAAAPDIIKPDVTAPGIQILAGASPIHGTAAAQGQLFQAIQGTSMSSPHVAGIFALIKQVHPDWSPAMAKSTLMTTAYQEVFKDDGVTPADPFDMGAGHVNPGGKAKKGSLFHPGLVYDVGLFEYMGFMCTEAPEIFLDPESFCATLESIGIPTDASDLNLPSIGIADLAGTQTVRRTVTAVTQDSDWHTYYVSTVAPPGYAVSVNPSRLTLKKGDTATYEITITNDGSAAIDKWTFGSLTWATDKGVYTVYSPIAVRGVLLSAPDEISGSGESGSASFDVKFGYTGNYEARAHGLVAATVTGDNVPQDPDQNFDPEDGFSEAHTFDLADVLHFRIAIPPEATEPEADLDVYVFDPDGNLVAVSFNAGTDELIDIVQPADGTWTVYVHGWSTPGGDSDYSMYSWAIPSAIGGSLQIDSAPTAAVIATTETIDVSWTGAALGEWHLGAVSHNQDGSWLDTTLVEVDNR
jgi:subtilisin family serine protease